MRSNAEVLGLACHYNNPVMEPSEQLWSEVRERCQLGLAQLGLSADAGQLEQCLAYLRLLQEWNRSYNLTAVRDPLLAVERHLLDSLSISAWLQPGAALDAGSGAGLPGIPLAIMQPARRWLLLDSNGKKVRFLRHVARTLKLANVMVMQQRLEHLQPSRLAPQWRPVQIVSRAFAPLPRQCEWAKHWLQHGCRLLAMVGALDEADFNALPASVELAACESLAACSDVAQQRHLIILQWRHRDMYNHPEVPAS